MSFQEEDEWLGLGSGFVLDDAFKCASPLGADTSLQVPLREPSPIAVSPQNLMDFPFGDNSLAVPMREFGFQSASDPPRLSPVSSSYQSMAPLQNMSYDMTSTTVMQEETYNSFEQPSVVVNGHYQPIEQQIIQPQQAYYQAVSDTTQHVLPTSQPQQAPSASSSTSSGSLVQQILSAPTTRQTPAPQHTRQRPIQPKSQSNTRKRPSANSHSSSANKSSKVDNSSNNTTQTEVRFSMSALQRITEIGAEMAQLQEQQEKLGINNSQRLSELQAQRASILYEALSSQNVGETVLSQVKQVAAAAAPTPPPRSTPRSRASHTSRQAHFEAAPESPQYQPQMYLASHNQYPSTSTAQFQEYPSGNANQAQVVHQQQEPVTTHSRQQRMYRTQNATAAVYHAASQLPPGTVYVQNVPQPAQAQFASPQPTVGEVVRQQHQLRHASGAQPVIVQQMSTPQVVVATSSHNQSGSAVQMRSQVVQQSPLPAQIVLAPAVQRTPVVVVAPRQSPAQTAKRIEEKRASRLSRLRSYFDNLQDSLANPDMDSPFTDLRDVLQRLLPYHAYGEADLSEDYVEQFDVNYLRTTINLSEQRKRLENRMRKVLYDEALRGTEREEQNLLLFLDCEYEKRKLEDEKEIVKHGDIEAFVRDSAIVAAMRDLGHENEKVQAQSSPAKPSCLKAVMQHYEYHPFEEIVVPFSPYKSPSPLKSPASSIRSPSPCKTPPSTAYSPRNRTRNTSQCSYQQSPSPLVESSRTRHPKSRTTSESTASDKSESRKSDSFRSVPLPPPLPSMGTRRSLSVRKAAEKTESSAAAHSPAVKKTADRGDTTAIQAPSISATTGEVIENPSTTCAATPLLLAGQPPGTKDSLTPMLYSSPSSPTRENLGKKQSTLRQTTSLAPPKKAHGRRDIVTSTSLSTSPGTKLDAREGSQNLISPESSNSSVIEKAVEKRIFSVGTSVPLPPPITRKAAEKKNSVAAPPYALPIALPVKSEAKKNTSLTPVVSVARPTQRKVDTRSSSVTSLASSVSPTRVVTRKAVERKSFISSATPRTPNKKFEEKEVPSTTGSAGPFSSISTKTAEKTDTLLSTSPLPCISKSICNEESLTAIPSKFPSATSKAAEKEFATASSIVPPPLPNKKASDKCELPATASVGVPSICSTKTTENEDTSTVISTESHTSVTRKAAEKKEVSALSGISSASVITRRASERSNTATSSTTVPSGIDKKTETNKISSAPSVIPSVPAVRRSDEKKGASAMLPVIPSSPIASNLCSEKVVAFPHASTPGRLPAKKELLCRARQGVPAEMRSPPAHTSLITPLMYGRSSLDDYDSDGSASPELGIDDIISPFEPIHATLVTRANAAPPVPTVVPVTANEPPHIITSSVTQFGGSVLQSTRASQVKFTLPPPPKLPTHKSVAPVQPLSPQKKEKLTHTSERSSSVAKQENIRPTKTDERPAERFRFKPQVPRPTPASPAMPAAKLDTTDDKGAGGIHQNCLGVNDLVEEMHQVPNCTAKPPPIRLKLKLSGKEMYIESNENSEEGSERKQRERKRKKKKKERRKDHRRSMAHIEEKQLKEHRRHHKKKLKDDTVVQELVAFTSNGVRMKLKFGAGATSRSATSSLERSSANEAPEIQKKGENLEPQPCTSKASDTGSDMFLTQKIRRLKIRIGSEEPPMVIAPPKDETGLSSVTQKPLNTALSEGARKLSASPPPPTIETTKSSSEPLAVEFSDDSDTEAERLRCATDKALRGMADLSGIPRPSTSVLPWSAQQAP